MMERVKCAAIKKDGEVYEGRNHAKIIHAHPHEFKGPNSTQGFVTNNGRFIDRKEAARIAFKAGQIPKQVSVLFSEDLTGAWPWRAPADGKSNDTE